jgi:hypothetical protein
MQFTTELGRARRKEEEKYDVSRQGAETRRGDVWVLTIGQVKDVG